jgi:hypothetical protein
MQKKKENIGGRRGRRIRGVRIKDKQERQCANNVALRRVRVTIVAVESNKYCIF